MKESALPLLLVLSLGLGGCGPDDSSSADAISEPAVVASSVPGFLEDSSDPQLSAWMEERFEAEYRNMTPELIFQQEPIANIQYDLRGLPTGAPLFHYASQNVSRREILHAVAKFFDLQMSLQGANGKITHVLVEGPGVRPAAMIAPVASTVETTIPTPPPVLNPGDESVLLPPEP